MCTVQPFRSELVPHNRSPLFKLDRFVFDRAQDAIRQSLDLRPCTPSSSVGASQVENGALSNTNSVCMILRAGIIAQGDHVASQANWSIGENLKIKIPIVGFCV
jgi:hypothetical protein